MSIALHWCRTGRTDSSEICVQCFRCFKLQWNKQAPIQKIWHVLFLASYIAPNYRQVSLQVKSSSPSQLTPLFFLVQLRNYLKAPKPMVFPCQVSTEKTAMGLAGINQASHGKQTVHTLRRKWHGDVCGTFNGRKIPQPKEQHPAGQTSAHW